MEYLEAAEAYRSTIRDLTSTPRPGPLTEQRRRLADANGGLGHCLKAAEVCATLAVAEEIASLRQLVGRAADVAAIQRGGFLS